MKTNNIAAMLLAVAFSLPVGAAIHVSPSAAKGGDGTAARPFASIQAAVDYAATLDQKDTIRISVAPGIYPIERSIVVSGHFSAPVVIEGSAADMPVVSGAMHLTDWQLTADGRWHTHIDAAELYGLKIEQLYVNGRRAIRARTPNVGEYYYIDHTNESTLHHGGGRMPLHAAQVIHAQDKADLQSLEGMSVHELNDVLTVFYHKWDETRRHIDYAVPDSSLFVINGKGMAPWNRLENGVRYYFENYMAALDAPGEWYLTKGGDLYYIPLEGETLQNADVRAPFVQRLLTVCGEEEAHIKDITVRNISFEYCAFVTPARGTDPMQAAHAIDAALHVDYAEGVAFENCVVQHTGNYGIWLDRACIGCRIDHCLFTDLGAGGVKVGEYENPEKENVVSRGNIINNNIIRKGGNVFPSSVGLVVFHSADNKLTHNNIYDLPYSGISVGWTWGYDDNYATGNEVAYNHIHHLGWNILTDMGAVYTVGIKSGWVHHNLIHHVYSYDYGGWGLYTDEGTSNVILENNLVYGCKDGNFDQHYGVNNDIRNNIFAWGIQRQVRMTFKPDSPQSLNFHQNIVIGDSGTMLFGPWESDDIKMSSNCYWDLRGAESPEFLEYTFKEWKKLKEPSSIMEDPGFKNAAALDFSFRSRKAIRKIGFVPFDISGAGIYGSNEWIKAGEMPEERAAEFDEIVRKKEAELPCIFTNLAR